MTWETCMSFRSIYQKSNMIQKKMMKWLLRIRLIIRLVKLLMRQKVMVSKKEERMRKLMRLTIN
jgi:hypothetical protein